MRLIRFAVISYALLTIVLVLFGWPFSSNQKLDEQNGTDARSELTNIGTGAQKNIEKYNEEHSQNVMDVVQQIEEGSLSIEEITATPYFLELAREAISGMMEDEDIETIFNPQSAEDRERELREQLVSPYDYAAGLYVEEGWAEVVSSMGLSEIDKQRVRQLYIEFTARNLELSEQNSNGIISWEQWASAYGRFEDLLQRLSPVLSTSQLAGLGEHSKRLEAEYEMRAKQATRQLLESSNSGLLVAATSNDFPTVIAYLHSGANPNVASDDGLTPLRRAANTGNALMVQALIDAGANVNWPPSGSGITSALAWAASKGHTASVSTLIAAGADLEHFAQYSFDTALHKAAHSGYTETVRTLLEAGADAAGDAGEKALASAIRLGDQEMEKMLIDAGANSNSSSATSQRMLKEIGRRLGFVKD